MKNLVLFFLFAATFSVSAQTSTGNCGCLECPVFIADNSVYEIKIPVAGLLNDSLSNPGQGLSGVKLKFEHEYLGDLNISLISPSNQSITLVAPVGFFAATDFAIWDVRFVSCDSVPVPDPGFSPIWNNNQLWETFGQYSGSYYPSSGCLENLNWGPANGIWRVIIVDGQASDSGNLIAAELIFRDTAGIQCDPCVIHPIAGFSASNGADGWSVALADSSSYGFNYQVDYGDGAMYSGVAAPLAHTYPDTGSYTIRWVYTNGCNSDTAFQTVYIQGALPTADFKASTGCASNPIDFTITAEDHVQNWHWLLPGAVPAESFEKQPQVSYPLPGDYDVCLIVSNGFGADTIKKTAAVSITPFVPTIAQYSWDLSGNQLLIYNQSQNADTYYWLLPDGVSFTFPYLSFNVTPPYVVDVQLVAANACDQDTAFVHIVIESLLPLANFVFEEQDVCLPRWVVYADNSTNVPTSWQWTFEGGTPSTATVANPFILYEQAGQFLTTLIVSNASGADTVEMMLNLAPPPAAPIASFFTSVSGTEISIFNNSQDAIYFQWQVNGVNYWGGPEPPPFVADSSGLYVITLFATNVCNEVTTFMETVQIGSSGINETDGAMMKMALFPNPNAGSCILSLQSVVNDAGAQIDVVDTQGKTVWSQVVQVNEGHQNMPVEMHELPSGVYVLRLNTKYGAVSRRFAVHQ